MVMSEGAEWEGYTVREYGEADAFGHRKKANVAEDFSDEIKKRTGDETVVSDLTYDLRSGAPDFTDKLVATAFASMGYDAIKHGQRGLMAAIVDGKYAMVEIPDPKLGPRSVDVKTMFNEERYRPSYENKEGMPVFLTKPW
jgi:6-phosphofructokinase 1